MTKLFQRLGVLCLLFLALSINGYAEKSDSKKDSTKTETVKTGSSESQNLEPANDPTLTGPLMELTVPEKEDPENPYPSQKDQTSWVETFSKWALLIVFVLFLVVTFSLSNVIGLMGDVTGKPSIDWEKWNPRLMILFMITFLSAGIWEAVHDSKYFFPESASEHGVKIDNMFNITTILILIVFFLTQIALFYFAYAYRMRKGHTAYFYPHNDRLEIIWTVIPAIALAILITGGLKAWNGITSPAPEGTQKIELYAFQFGWKARYAGEDKHLGHHNFRMINETNDMGIDWEDKGSHDDVVTNSEIHIIKGQNVEFKFRAKDVIHSAYMPYFRLQMNVVPGVPTSFWMKPTKTTAEMREILTSEGRENASTFDYYLYCNKICGSAHYNMKIKIVVDEEADYKKWWASQKPEYAKMHETEAPAVTPAVAPSDTSSKKDNQTALIIK